MELCSNDRLQRESIQVLRHSKTTGQIGSYSDGNTSATSSCDGATDILESLGLYRQAVPLVQPQSTAAIKTLRKMAGSSDLANRMLARNQAASRATLTDDSETANPESRSTFQAQGDGKWARKQLEFLAICEQMLLTFDSAIVRQKCIKLSRVKELLDVFELPVSDTMYRQWEQSLPAAAVTIPATAFVQACRLWFTEDFMIEHMKLRLARTRTIDSNSCSPAPESLHQRARHPFNLMAESNDAAAAFSYHDYARNPPPEPPRPSLTSSASAPALINEVRDRQRQQRQKQLRAKQKRLENTEMARAFSASVAMISRHVQNEELRDIRDASLDRQVARVDDRKLLNRLHKAHCQALAEDKTHQQMQQVSAMKALTKEELQLTRELLDMRQEMLRSNKPPFALSASTSTVFQQPPEILAAKATAKTVSDKKKLQFIEKEHLEHMRSLQLLDYVYDKKRAVLEALKPRADAALVQVEIDDLPEEQALQFAKDELWNELLQQEAASGGDFATFVPPTNSPPAALRYFGTSRPVVLPPFASSTVRDC